MSKVRIELNSPAIRALLKSPEMEAVLGEHAERIATTCGAGYAHDTHQTPGRAVASVYTDSADAVRDNLENNTILRSLK